jgi:hypothetical protein
MKHPYNNKCSAGSFGFFQQRHCAELMITFSAVARVYNILARASGIQKHEQLAETQKIQSDLSAIN